eukprot:augustus_masked-scaffold_7-processed-gene-19.113-mRNA-1 protein AED:1.00 eAED:1.00 QI:0/-1/0/0/-1/1/1/0/568
MLSEPEKEGRETPTPGKSGTFRKGFPRRKQRIPRIRMTGRKAQQRKIKHLVLRSEKLHFDEGGRNQFMPKLSFSTSNPLFQSQLSTTNSKFTASTMSKIDLPVVNLSPEREKPRLSTMGFTHSALNRGKHISQSISGQQDESVDGIIKKEHEKTNRKRTNEFKNIYHQDFDSLQLTPKELINSATKMLCAHYPGTTRSGRAKTGLPMRKGKSTETHQLMKLFVTHVFESYTPTIYHNFNHALDVTQLMFLFIEYFFDFTSFRDNLREDDEVSFEPDSLDETQKLGDYLPFVLILSCLLHDVGHFGANNAFLRNEERIRKNYPEIKMETSPLEAFHFRKAKALIEDSEIFSEKYVQKSILEEILVVVEILILATDMDLPRHQHYVNLFNEKRPTPRSPNEPLSVADCILAIKICDLANVSRNFPAAKNWARMLNSEFEAMGRYSQSEEESLSFGHLIRLQKPKLDKDMVEAAKFTNKFISKFALPLAQMFERVDDRASYFLVNRMANNMIEWFNLIENGGEVDGDGEVEPDVISDNIAPKVFKKLPSKSEGNWNLTQALSMEFEEESNF